MKVESAPYPSRFTEGLHSLLRKPCTDRPFVCAGRPESCTVLLIGENPATTVGLDWWNFWDDESGFGFDHWDRVMRAARLESGKREYSATRLRINRLRTAGVSCLETNVFMNERLAGHGTGKSNSDLLDLALNSLPGISTIVAHGKVAQDHLAQRSVPSHIRIERTRHFRLLSYEEIDLLAASIRAGMCTARAVGVTYAHEQGGRDT